MKVEKDAPSAVSSGDTNLERPQDSIAAPVKDEEKQLVKEEDEEEADDEENFLCAIEKQNENNDIVESKDAQPKKATEAPRLLQDALKSGEVKADESEANKEEKKATEGSIHDQERVEEEKKEESSHIHARVSFVSFPFWKCFECLRAGLRAAIRKSRSEVTLQALRLYCRVHC